MRAHRALGDGAPACLRHARPRPALLSHWACRGHLSLPPHTHHLLSPVLMVRTASTSTQATVAHRVLTISPVVSSSGPHPFPNCPREPLVPRRTQCKNRWFRPWRLPVGRNRLPTRAFHSLTANRRKATWEACTTSTTCDHARSPPAGQGSRSNHAPGVGPVPATTAAATVEADWGTQLMPCSG